MNGLQLWKSIFAAILCIGAAYYFALCVSEQQQIDKSIGWHITTGKLLAHSDEIGEGTADGMLIGPLAWLRFIGGTQTAVYTYEINGQKFTQVKSCTVPTLTVVRMFVNREAFEFKCKAPKTLSEKSKAAIREKLDRFNHGQRGAIFQQSEAEFEDWRPSVNIRYNPANPQQSEIDPSAMRAPEAIKDTGAVLILLGLTGLLLLSFHEWITAPVEDPMLNLDTAIAYYKKNNIPLPVRYRY